jgi:hydrogenase maturation protease
MNKEVRQILIAGVGNTLLSDEGVGVHAARRLSRENVRDNVNVVDCGTDLLSLSAHIDCPQKIIIIDAVRSGKPPGAVSRFSYGDLVKMKSNMRSAHQISIVDILKLFNNLYLSSCASDCAIVVIAVEPKTLEFGEQLSPEVNRSLAEVIRRVMEEIRCEGIRPCRPAPCPDYRRR